MREWSLSKFNDIFDEKNISNYDSLNANKSIFIFIIFVLKLNAKEEEEIIIKAKISIAHY